MEQIYGLFEPEEIRYIGKAKSPRKRFEAHLEAARDKKRNAHVYRWLRKLARLDIFPTQKIIATVPEGVSWQAIEMYCIQYFKEAGADLTNMTDGGEGGPGCPLGFKQTKETCQKRSETMRLPEQRRKSAARTRTFWTDPVFREKTRRAMLGKFHRSGPIGQTVEFYSFERKLPGLKNLEPEFVTISWEEILDKITLTS